MAQFRSDDSLDVAFGVDNSFLPGGDRSAAQPPARREDSGEAHARSRHDAALLLRVRDLVNDAGVDGRGDDNVEHLALEGVRRPAQLDFPAEVVAAGVAAGQGWIVRYVHLFSLRNERIARQRVGILAADEGAELADRRVQHTQGGSVAEAPHHLFRIRRHELAVPEQDVSLGSDNEIGVIECAERIGRPLVHADDDVGPSAPSRFAQARGRGTWYFDRVLDELDMEGRRPEGIFQPDPVWVPRHKCFRKGDEIRARARRFGDERADLVEGALAVQEDRGSLNRGGFEFRKNVAHRNLLPCAHAAGATPRISGKRRR